ncbi:translation initiation factor IF-2-like [Passer montanus]|uniref:translation initiation factor IF-2-like n=1 Tax=Passer montanus TaxID=9160 RepID=UPI00196167E2|nr:translation initiation factor IF-2-like [Passer montanus]
MRGGRYTLSAAALWTPPVLRLRALRALPAAPPAPGAGAGPGRGAGPGAGPGAGQRRAVAVRGRGALGQGRSRQEPRPLSRERRRGAGSGHGEAGERRCRARRMREPALPGGRGGGVGGWRQRPPKAGEGTGPDSHVPTQVLCPHGLGLLVSSFSRLWMKSFLSQGRGKPAGCEPQVVL